MRQFNYKILAASQWDSEVIAYLRQIYEYKGKQELFGRQKPVELERLVEIAKIQSTEASNKIEGIVTTKTRLNQLMQEKTMPRNRDEREIAGYRDVLNLVHESYGYIDITANHILQLHGMLMRYADDRMGGHFKNVQNYISETLPDGTQAVRFTPIAPYETEDHVRRLCASYQEARSLERVEPLLLLPIFLVDFLCIHPFNDGNGRMSRILTLLLLYQAGFEVGKYISIEKHIEKTKAAYYDCLEAADQNWQEGKNDPLPFVKYMLGVILACYREFEERIDIMVAGGAKSSAYDIVQAAVKTRLGKFSKKELVSICPSLSESSVEAALRKMVEEGKVAKMGSGRGTFYVSRL